MTDLARANDEMVREFLQAWERRDTEHIVERFAVNGVYHSIPLTPIVGRDAIRAFVTGFEDVPPGRLEIRHQVAAEYVVLNERTDFIRAQREAGDAPDLGCVRDRRRAHHGVARVLRPRAGARRLRVGLSGGPPVEHVLQHTHVLTAVGAVADARVGCVDPPVEDDVVDDAPA